MPHSIQPFCDGLIHFLNQTLYFRWTFKLYDKDGSGEIDPTEMEDIFKKLCKIAAGIESDQNKIIAKVIYFTRSRHYYYRSYCRKRKRKNSDEKKNLKD